MRVAGFVVVLALAACNGGDDDGAGPIDAAEPDAAMPDAAEPDAAEPDAPAAGPMLVWENAPYDLGLVEVGTAATRTVTLRNAGGAGTGVLLSTDGADLTIVQDDCVTLAPGETCDATVRLAVNAGGAAARELRAFPVAGGDVALAPVTATGGHRLTVNRGGIGGAVTSAPAGIDCGTDCNELLAAGTVVTLTAQFTPPTMFQGWSGGGCSGTAATCVVTLNANTTVGAFFQTGATLTIQFAGLGAGLIRGPGTGATCAVGSCSYPVTVGNQYQLSQHILGDSVLQSWTGCSTADNNCTITATGNDVITATYGAVAPAQWVRSTRTEVAPHDLALVPGGFVVVGGAVPSGLWIGRYQNDGTVGFAFTDATAAYASRALIEASGDTLVLAATAAGELRVRRYTPAGMRTLDLAPGGNHTLNTGGLAVDAAGNFYVCGAVSGTYYIASYTPAGVQRWRRNAPAGVESIQGLAVRGTVLAAVGSIPAQGWVATYDLDGNIGWQRTTPGQVQFPQLDLFEAAIDSDGDVIFAGLDTSSAPLRYVVGAMSADGTAQQWVMTRSTRATGELVLLGDDTLRLWIGYNTVGPDDYSTLRTVDEAGTETASQNVLNVRAPGGFAVDAAGAVFLAGYDWTGGFPSIERR